MLIRGIQACTNSVSCSQEDLWKECWRWQLGIVLCGNCIPKCHVGGRDMECNVRGRGSEAGCAETRVHAYAETGTNTSSCLQQIYMSFGRIMSCCCVEQYEAFPQDAAFTMILDRSSTHCTQVLRVMQSAALATKTSCGLHVVNIYKRMRYNLGAVS